jgi:hypothetical protein
MVLLLSLSFCHSQTVQTVNGKEVIVMSVEDGNKLNKVFSDQQKQIDSLKKIADSSNAVSKRFQDKHELYLKDQYNKQFQIDTLKTRMEANKRIYEKTDKLRLYTIRHATIFNLAIMFLLGFISTAH